MADRHSENFVSSEGGARQAEAAAQRDSASAPDKMENELEMKKSSKNTIDDATEVAGREKKGTGTQLLEKMVPGNK